MRFSRAGISKCDRCPLRDRNRVWGEGPEEGPLYQAFLGEAPGEQEDLKRHPFVGPSGGLLSRGLTEAGTERFRCWVFNLIGCRPPGNKLESFEGQEALGCCKKGFEAEVDYLAGRGLRVLTTLGAYPLSAMGVETSIGKARGSVYEVPKKSFIILPAYHPAFLLYKGLQKEIPTWIADLAKAHELSRKVYKKPKERFNLFPSLADLKEFIDAAVKNKQALGVDIETIGLRPDRSKIMVVGLARTSEDAISVPFFSQGLRPYWKDGDLSSARDLLQRAFDSCPLIFQNALFDVLHLRFNGFRLRATNDVLLAHHAIHPELPHKLGYIVSIYGTTPYWKDTLLNREDLVLNMDDEELRRYNLRDSVVLHQVLEPLQKDLQLTGTSHIYENYSMPLVEVLADSTSFGISLDRKALKAWSSSLRRKKTILEKKIKQDLALPTGFNLDSDEHLRKLIYGAEVNQFRKAEEDLKAYEPGAREALGKKPLRKDTAKYRDLLEKVEVSRETPHLWGEKHGGKLTASRAKLSVDDQNLLALYLACLKRKSVIEAYHRKDADDLEELLLVKKTILFLNTYRAFAETSTLLSTFSDFPTWKDGKVHTSFLIHGTKTGRLASRDPNLQNIPVEARKVFRARPGRIFIEGDYSNLEPRILAYISGDTTSIKTFEEGKNIHDANTIALFPESQKTDSDWKAKRAVAKKYRLAMNYGGGLYSIYEKCCIEAPELNLSFPVFRDADARYRAEHEKETLWLEKTKKLAVEKRELRNAFNRIRIFLGTENEIEREGVNFPIQSTAADIIGPAMIQLHQELKNLKDAHLLLQVHDSILVECRKEDKKKVLALMKGAMEKKVVIGKKEITFPVEFKSGANWGEMK